jgi:hypothetical protein
MSTIDPAGRTLNAGDVNFIDHNDLDPATVLLALSVNQMAILQESLTVRVNAAHDKVGSLTEIGQAIHDLDALKNSVQEQELADARDVQDRLNTFASQADADPDGRTTVTEEEYAYLQQLMVEAQRRGYDGPPLALPEEVEFDPFRPFDWSNPLGPIQNNPLFQGPGDRIEYVIDRAAVTQFLDKLDDYIYRLPQGRADNPVLEELFENNSGFPNLQSDLAALGITGVNSFAEADAALEELRRQLGTAVAESRTDLNQLRLLTGEITDKSLEVGDAVRTQVNDANQRAEDRFAEERALFEQLEIDETLKQQIEELLTEVQNAEDALARSAMDPKALDKARENLSDAAYERMMEELRRWQDALDMQLAGEVNDSQRTQRVTRSPGQYV